MRAVLPRSASIKRRGDRLVINQTPVEVAWIGEGWLHDVGQLLAHPDTRPDIAVARRMSPGAREVLSKRGIGWVDENGAAEISMGPIVVSRSGHAEVAMPKDPHWTPSLLAVSEALLCGGTATVEAMQEQTGLSAGTCTKALKSLSDLGLTMSDAARGRNSARRVDDFNRLLDAYAAAAQAMPALPGLSVGVQWRDAVEGLGEVGRRWNLAGDEWAATGASAATVMAPLLTTVSSADVYVAASSPVELESIAADAGLRPIEGGRLTLRAFPTTATRRLARAVGGLQVAPWPRVYADLRSHGVRGEEAAEHLREVMRDK